MSLYANLLKKKDPTAAAPATISSEPVRYSFKKAEDEAKEEKKAPDAALRFQPSVQRRPQPPAPPKPKPRPSLPPPSTSPDKLPPSSLTDSKACVVPESIENWIDEDADDYYAAEYQRHQQEQKERQKDAKKRRKKKSSQSQHDIRDVDWNTIYDPEQPIRLEDYRGSLEELDAKYEWKRRLHAHERKKSRPDAPQSHPSPAPLPAPLPAPSTDKAGEASLNEDARQDDEDDDYEPPPAASIPPVAGTPTIQSPLTAPPPSAPPPFIPGLPPLLPGMPFPPGPWQLPPGAIPPPPPPPGMLFPAPPPGMPVPPPPALFVPLPPQFVSTQPPVIPSPIATPPVPTPPAAPTPPSQSSAVISRAPVRFTQPSPKPEDDQDGEEEPQNHGGLGFPSATVPDDPEPASDPEEDQPRSNRPGQKGFAKRLLQKYGWKEGEGLGASGTGITTILQHQTQKRKKKSDSEGGGWAGPAVGRIVGGKKQKVQAGADADNDAGAGWSIVAKFDGMLAGLDIDAEMRDGDLMQKMGEKMAEYGHVERLYIHRAETGDDAVFVKFTSALSAYRAVQASDDYDFLANGRVVKSAFWDEEKFAQGVYE